MLFYARPVEERSPGMWWQPPGGDVLFALAMAAFALYGGARHGGWYGPTWVNAVVVTGMALGLAFRRTAPLVVLVSVSASIALLGIAYGSSQAWSSLMPFFVAIYSAAVYAPPIAGSTLAILGVVTVTVVVREVHSPYVESLGDASFSSALAVLALLAGLEGRRIAVGQHALAERTARFEREEQTFAAAVAAEERQRIGRELHDVLSHGLGVMVLQAGAAEQIVEGDPVRARDVLVSIRTIGRDAVRDLSTMLGLLQGDEEKPSREPPPRLVDVPLLIDRARASGADIEFTSPEPMPRLSPTVELSAYRVLQEGVTNALKHAHGGAIKISLAVRKGALELTIADDGADRGAKPMASGGRRGLTGIAERVAVFGGDYEAGPNASGGWTLRVRLPLAR